MQIKNYPNYDVREDGTVWSNTRRGGDRGKVWPWRQLIPLVTNHGYLRLWLTNQSGKRKVLVHHLVLEAFVGPRPHGLMACHNDGNKLNNTPSNLRWGTAKDNHDDSVRHGTAVSGGRVHFAKLSEASVKALRSEYAQGGITGRQLGPKYGITQSTVSKITRRRNWAHVA